MPAKFIVIFMLLILIVLFIIAKKYRQHEVEREKLEIEEFEKELKQENP